MAAPQMGAPGPVAAGSQAQGQSTTDTAIVSDLDASRKAYLTLQARAAINGVSLYELAGGKFLLCKWTFSRWRSLFDHAP